MLSNSQLVSSVYNIADYDEIGDTETHGFTQNLDKIQFLTPEDPFIYYLAGSLYTYGLEDVSILHGYYHTENYNLKLYITQNLDNRCKTGIWVIWNRYVDIITHTTKREHEARVHIYDRYCMELYEDNNYDYDEKAFYK